MSSAEPPLGQEYPAVTYWEHVSRPPPSYPAPLEIFGSLEEMVSIRPATKGRSTIGGSTAQGEWTWMGGSNLCEQPGRTPLSAFPLRTTFPVRVPKLPVGPIPPGISGYLADMVTQRMEQKAT